MKKTIKILVLTTLVVAVLWFPVKSWLLYEYGITTFNIVSGLILQRLGLKEEPKSRVRKEESTTAVSTDTASVDPDSPYRPFTDIGDTLGDLGRFNSMLLYRGGTIFDANGDGRLDIYLPHSGRPVEKDVDENNVLQAEHAPAKPSTLFINQGNDSKSNPVFKSVPDLIAGGNNTLVRKELMIENKYIPRASVKDDPLAPGRIALGAVAADFNGDGRTDLFVANTHYGMLGQTHEFATPVYPAKENIGRDARQPRERVLVRMANFLWGDMTDGKDITVKYGASPEPEGRNSMYINLGDQDGDGIPEWEDVTDKAGVGGRWASAGVTVADFDRDGDLDFYVSNYLDVDFWGFAARYFAGQRNEFYVNQLAETGRLEFINKAEAFGVSGLQDQEGLSDGIWNPITQQNMPTSEHIVDGVQYGEKADHTWTALFTDFNRDGWPDLVVANDLSNRLRVYENRQGKGFRYLPEFNDYIWDGCWMGIEAADFDGDLTEEIMVGNCGTQGVTVRNNGLFIEDGTEVNIWALFTRNYFLGKSTLHHLMLAYDDKKGLYDIAPDVRINHSSLIPPDVTNIKNFARGREAFYHEKNIATSLTGIEFIWNPAVFDVDNDGDQDLYMVGALRRGNDNFIGDWTGNPGRLLVNESQPNHFEFTDRTMEYRLLDIRHMEYDHNPPRRPSPGTGWHKRDYIYLMDEDAYSGSGLEAADSSIRDIYRMHEAASNAYAPDLNGDGYLDLVVLHQGGYNSLSPTSGNLLTEFAGRTLAIPAPNKVMAPPPTFEEGHTSIYINPGPPRGEQGNWVKIRLQDDSGFNRYGVGSKIVVNDDTVRRFSIGGSFGSVTGDIHVGLGSGQLNSLTVHWASGDMDVQHITLDESLQGQLVCVARNIGITPCAGGALVSN